MKLRAKLNLTGQDAPGCRNTPSASWQAKEIGKSGINDNTDGLCRTHVPQGIPLSGFARAELDAVA